MTVRTNSSKSKNDSSSDPVVAIVPLYSLDHEYTLLLLEALLASFSIQTTHQCSMTPVIKMMMTVIIVRIIQGLAKQLWKMID